MRRWLAGLSVLALMGLATTAFGGDTANYLDDFPAPVYNGSSGSLDWSYTSWQEIGDDGKVDSGAVHVDLTPEHCPDAYKCLHLFPEGTLSSPIGVMRYADLSVLETADLCFEVATSGDASGVTLKVYVTADGANWTKVKVYNGVPEYDHPTIDVSDFISDGFAVRFEMTGSMVDGEVFIDTVELKGSYATVATTTPSTSSTTSTSKPSTTSTTKPRPTTTSTVDTVTTTSKPRITETTDTTPTTPTTAARTSTTAETTTTTIVPVTTTTSGAALVIPPSGPPPGSGIREADTGLQANYETGMFKSMDGGDGGRLEVLSAEFDANYEMAAEVIRSSWVWMIALAVVITAAIISGMERRRSRESLPET